MPDAHVQAGRPTRRYEDEPDSRLHPKKRTADVPEDAHRFKREREESQYDGHQESKRRQSDSRPIEDRTRPQRQSFT